MKTLGLAFMIAVALPLSACRVEGQCDDFNGSAYCHGHPPNSCYSDSDCGSGYVCQDWVCILPVPPGRDAGYGVGGAIATGAGGDIVTGTGGRIATGTGGRIADGGMTADTRPGTGGAAGMGGASGTGGAARVDAGPGVDTGTPPGPDAGMVCPDAGADGGGSCRVHPAPVCEYNHQCGLGGRCLDGECQRPCTTDTTCGTGQVCAQGFCQTPTTSGGHCVFNTDCSGGNKTCINGVCHANCHADADCSAADRCVGNICQPYTGPTPQCRATADCAGVHVTEDECVNAVCRTPCFTNDDCCVGSSGSVCQMGYCVTEHEVAPMCRLSNDCGTGRVCIDAACE